VIGAVVVAALMATGAGIPSGAQPAARPGPEQVDPLTAAARRAARAWERHDFAALVAGSPGVMVRLGNTETSAPMSPEQAALTLHAFAGGAEEIQTLVTSVREVDAGRGYAEVQRTFVVNGTSARRVQTLYLEWRLVGGVHRLVEIRVMP
jgi:hypothetical protein